MTNPRAPILEAGDCLTRDEFERRYAAMPVLKKAELIEGTVHMGSPVSYSRHAHPESLLSSWLTFYAARTPGLLRGHNVSLRLDLDNEPQPDLMLAIPAAAGGATRIADDGFLVGPPELVLEVAASSVSQDLHQKKNVYRRSGVAEYLVYRVDDGAVDWFGLEAGRYVPLGAGPDGVLASRVFPGLWLDVAALLVGDLLALQRAVGRGAESDAHAAFCRRLAP